MGDIRDRLAEENPDLIFFDGYDECIIGTVSKYGAESVVCYDLNAMISKMVKEGMTEEHAWEWFDYNIIGGYHGKYTPCFLKLALPDMGGCMTPFMEEPEKDKKPRKKRTRKPHKSDTQTQGWVDVITKKREE